MGTSLDEEIKQAKREYYKQWRLNNKDKVKAKNQRYWEKRTLKLKKESESNGATKNSL